MRMMPSQAALPPSQVRQAGLVDPIDDAYYEFDEGNKYRIGYVEYISKDR